MPHYVPLEDVRGEFLERAFRVVWCSAATVDSKGRPRSRVLHPIWDDNLIGWIATWRDSLKAKHLAAVPYMSIAYVGEPFQPAYVECRAEWDDSVEAKQRVYELFRDAPAPMGYDTIQFFGPVENPRHGILKLTPNRIEVVRPPAGHFVWRRDQD